MEIIMESRLDLIKRHMFSIACSSHKSSTIFSNHSHRFVRLTFETLCISSCSFRSLGLAMNNLEEF